MSLCGGCSGVCCNVSSMSSHWVVCESVAERVMLSLTGLAFRRKAILRSVDIFADVFCVSSILYVYIFAVRSSIENCLLVR